MRWRTQAMKDEKRGPDENKPDAEKAQAKLVAL
jgi:hypothetical protein